MYKLVSKCQKNPARTLPSWSSRWWSPENRRKTVLETLLFYIWGGKKFRIREVTSAKSCSLCVRKDMWFEVRKKIVDQFLHYCGFFLACFEPVLTTPGKIKCLVRSFLFRAPFLGALQFRHWTNCERRNNYKTLLIHTIEAIVFTS